MYHATSTPTTLLTGGAQTQFGLPEVTCTRARTAQREARGPPSRPAKNYLYANQ